MDFQFHLTHLHIKTETRKIVYWCIIMSKTDLGNEMNMQQDLYVVYMHTKKKPIMQNLVMTSLLTKIKLRINK
jgi:hypothetical protein